MDATRKPESALFQEGNVTVTNARFMVGSQTYAIRNITSVEKRTKKAPKLFCIVVGAILAAIGGYGNQGIGNVSMFVIGIILLIAGVLMKHKYFVVLHTSASQMQALESKNQGYINKVINALNSAILYH